MLRRVWPFPDAHAGPVRHVPCAARNADATEVRRLGGKLGPNYAATLRSPDVSGRWHGH
jgi:hypothetical protein